MWRPTEAGRNRCQLVHARRKAITARPTKLTAYLTVMSRRVTWRPSALTGSKRDSDEDGGGACFLPASVVSISATCPGVAPEKRTDSPAASADLIHCRRAHAPARSRLS